MSVKKLRIFDMDDTLVKTSSKIYVTNGDTKLVLTPGEFAVYSPRKGDQFDYSDFKSLKEPKEIVDITKILKAMAKSTGVRDLFILTARTTGEHNMLSYLKSIGVPKIKIITLGSADPKDKADWIEGMIKNEGYNDVFFIDDSNRNVTAVNQMLRKYPNVKKRIVHYKG